MDDNTVEKTETEVVAPTEKVGISLREKLEEKFDAKDESARVEPAKQSEPVEQNAQASSQVEPKAAQPEKVVIAPPPDMNKEEREAFLNPTAQNNHILQQYLSRRAYETRNDYKRQTAELEQTRQKIGSVYDAVAAYEKEYARDGISIADVTKRSIEWDLAMKANPTQTALEYLDSYGVSLEDLYSYIQNGGFQQPQDQQQSYLTQEDAERIAQEKIDALIKQQQESFIAQQNNNIVQSFITSKPLFRDPGTAAQLEDAMEPIVAGLSAKGGNPQEILERAYDFVTLGDPTFSALRKKFEAPQVVEQAQKETERAKAA
ncbi:MAG: hypothetical protein EBX40_06340, partial [Gammaproteobacteria bacterium]|nr:hypothetical protein [Gammaproteobacteria bacterium]